MTVTESAAPSNFIKNVMLADLESGKHQGIVTRFPPEPNGYLHIGHAKAICISFGLAQEFNGRCHLRFDDTNPVKEDVEYVEAIQRDIKWLGFDWGEHLYYASDYFDRLYAYAEELIGKGLAYVDDLSAEEIRAYRGTLTEPGRESPYRGRSPEENLDLFRRMRDGEFEDGSRVLRAKIDMASPNITMRDPTLYRIRRAHHHRTGDRWCIYPLYDFTHCISDAIEKITHSLCSLEFENNRPLYDWVLDHITIDCHPQQIEFSRLNIKYTVMSKRYLLKLVEEGSVSGWDDPRMPTVSGMRRRGYTPEAIRAFVERVGVSKSEQVIDPSVLEDAVRDDLNTRAPRVMGVLRPLKVVIENWPEDRVEEIDAPYFPEDVGKPGSRKVPFTRELFIERDDFMENPPGKYKRMSPGADVRLRRAYVVKCTDVVKDAEGNVVELRCTHDPETLNANPADGRKVKGPIHWVSATRGVEAEVRLYDRLFKDEEPGSEGRHYDESLNPASLEVVRARVEESLGSCSAGDRFQFERTGYFYVDPDSRPGAPVFNRIVGLRDSWSKMVAQGKA